MTNPYARVVSTDWEPPEEPVPVLTTPFRPDRFQRQAFHFIGRGEPVLVTAHTSSGKTLIAEYAVAYSTQRGERALYTSPIKALSNQKYHEFKSKFESVGIVTGDIQIDREASCVVMTTEILRNLLYKKSLDQDVKCVVFDEVHYINDRERGVVWEECLILLHRGVRLVLLSATISNSLEFAEWIGRTRGETINIVTTDMRVVPLRHIIYADDKLYDLDGEIIKELLPSQRPPQDEKRKVGCRDGERGDFVNYFKKKQAGVNVVKLARWVAEKGLTPSIFFCFSRVGCERFARNLVNVDLVTQSEEAEISNFISLALSSLTEEDRRLPQVRMVRKLASKGVGVHFSSLMPILKEMVELLLSSNLLKILVATETFAMGVNMPARSCVFLSVKKVELGAFRYLTPAEYTQMSGRAGRRGKDDFGMVVIAPNETIKKQVLRTITSGGGCQLVSQFRISFSVIVSAIRSGMKVEELIRKSFGEDKVQKNVPIFLKRVGELNNTLESIPMVSCNICHDLDQYCRNMKGVSQNYHRFIKSSGIGKFLKRGEELLLKSNVIVKFEDVLPSGKVVVNEYVDGIRDNSGDYLNEPHVVFKASGSSKKAIDPSMVFCSMEGIKLSSISVLDIGMAAIANKMMNCLNAMNESSCIRCPNLSSHYKEFIKRQVVVDEIVEMTKNISDSNLSIISEYHNRINFLNRYGYIDNMKTTIKGNVASEIRTMHDILVTELVFSNALSHMTGSVIVSILSSMIYSENSIVEVHHDLISSVEVIKSMNEKVRTMMSNFKINEGRQLNFNAVSCVYKWMSGGSLHDIVNMGIAEGAFIKLLLRLDEACKEMINISLLIGDNRLSKEMTKASEELRRENIIVASLYL